MALSDLLWACPECGTDRGLVPEGRHIFRRHTFRCAGCGTRFRRDRGARIRAVPPDGKAVVREASEWVDRLPDVAGLLDGAGEGPVRTARVEIRWATKTDVVHGEDGYLNRVEIFDEPGTGRLVLEPESLTLEADAGGEIRWPLARLTAVQASSSTLQLKVRETPLVSLRFHDDSTFLWENLLQAALQRLYQSTGRGRIVEFQPRIVAGREGRGSRGSHQEST